MGTIVITSWHGDDRWQVHKNEGAMARFSGEIIMRSMTAVVSSSLALGGLLAVGQAGAGFDHNVQILDNQCLGGGQCADLAATGLDVEGGEVNSGILKRPARTPGSDDGNDKENVPTWNATRPDVADIRVSGFDTDREGQSIFDFYWGSVDSYNVMNFSDGSSYTGSDLAALALGDDFEEIEGNYHLDRYVQFTGYFDWVELSSNQNAFEVARVPAPGTLALLGAGLLGMGIAARRRLNR